MHGIVKPIDVVLSTESAEWHGLADKVETIGAKEVAPLLFPITEGKIIVEIDGAKVSMGNHKALVADFRNVRPDLIGDESTSEGLVPLHIPKKRYRPILNGELWAAMEKSLRDIHAKVTTVGTFEAAKKFFISVKLDAENKFTVNGDKFLANLNFITSHDGTLGVKAYDSTVRIVCMNTLRASLSAQGDVGFNVFHTSGADTAMQNLGELVNEVLAGRGKFRTDMEYLASKPIDAQKARMVTLGYFVRTTDSDELSTRAINAADEIALLFVRGAGNKGKTLYDLLNGATEYWTNGNGTGKTASVGEKIYRANFAEAADHKDRFFNFLMNPDTVESLFQAGKRAEVEIVRKESLKLAAQS